MTPAKRKQTLKALDIETWVRRDAEPVADVPAAPLATQPLATQPEAEKRGRGRPRLDPATAVASAPAKKTTAVPRTDYVAPSDWEGLRAAVKACERCKLCPTRTQTVFGVGVEDASLMVVGEGPGADEDASGEPFIGRAGKLLDEML